jgi:AcrR family transcriptional regulator
VSDPGLSRERILEAAVCVLRRFGPEKATVVDVARALGVTHASVYRYFSSKAALRDAVVRQWLEAMMPPLEEVVAEGGPAPERLRRWLDVLIGEKRKRVTEDPQLFAAYHALVSQSRDIVQEHIDALVDQAAKIIADGAALGEFVCDDPAVVGRAVLNATCRFHNPAHAAEWSSPANSDRLEEVWQLLMCGLKPDSKAPKSRHRSKSGSDLP